MVFSEVQFQLRILSGVRISIKDFEAWQITACVSPPWCVYLFCIPLLVSLIETTYQPVIPLFHKADIARHHPELKEFPDCASAFAIEIRTGLAPDRRIRPPQV